MGAEIRAYLQFDDNSLPSVVPFTNEPSTWDLTGDLGLRAAKDYGFYAAIAGVRNRTELAPLIPPRGLPPHSASDPIRDLFDHLAVGWLTLAEINAALSHMNIQMETLSDQVLLVLDVMSAAEQRLGLGRCRLVFGFTD